MRQLRSGSLSLYFSGAEYDPVFLPYTPLLCTPFEGKAPSGHRFFSVRGTCCLFHDLKHFVEAYQLVNACLTDDLRIKPWRDGANPRAGYCYVVAEALWHMTGGKRSPYKPMFVKVDGVPHWFLKHERYGDILDPTADQFEWPHWLDHQQGRGKGFLTKKPSLRAKILIKRMKKFLTLGAEESTSSPSPTRSTQ